MMPENVIYPLFTLFIITIATTNADQPDAVDMSNENQVSMERPNSFYETSQKRASGFVRIGKNVDPSYMNDRYVEKHDDAVEPIPKVMKMVPWYPHLHRFIRIGRDSEWNVNNPQRSTIIGWAGNGRQPDIRSKKSNFVRIGRAGQVRLPLTYSVPPNKQNKEEIVSRDDKRMQGFVRIGKESSGDINSQQKRGFNYKYKKNGFVRIGKSLGDNEFHLTGDLDDGPSDVKRASGFVRIGKDPIKSMNEDINDVYRDAIGQSLTAKMKRTFPQLDDGTFANNYDREESGGVGKPNFNDKYKGNAIPPNDEIKTDKRVPGFVRIGKLDINGDHGLSSDEIRPKKFKLRKRSSYSRREAPSSEQNVETILDQLDRPTSRRSAAFVRIGKIPSSAFVRIGKNFDRILHLPLGGARYHHREFRRKGASAFVRIG